MGPGQKLTSQQQVRRGLLIPKMERQRFSSPLRHGYAVPAEGELPAGQERPAWAAPVGGALARSCGRSGGDFAWALMQGACSALCLPRRRRGRSLAGPQRVQGCKPGASFRRVPNFSFGKEKGGTIPCRTRDLSQEADNCKFRCRGSAAGDAVGAGAEALKSAAGKAWPNNAVRFGTYRVAF